MTPLKLSSLRRKVEIGEDLDHGALRVGEHHRLLDAGRDVALPFAFDAGLLQPRHHFAGIAAGRDLQRQPRRAGLAAALQHNRFETRFGGEDHPVLLARRNAQADNAREMIERALDIGRGQRRMARALDVQHGTFPILYSSRVLGGFAELVRPHLDLELAEHRRRTADDDVAGLHRADALGRAGIEQVARIERVERRGEFDQAAAIIDQVAGIAASAARRR